MRRCGSGRAAWLAQNLRGAEGRCDSVRVFCEAGVDRAFTASQRISSGWWGRVGVEGKDGGCDGKGALPGREDCGCENDVRRVSCASRSYEKESRRCFTSGWSLNRCAVSPHFFLPFRGVIFPSSVKVAALPAWTVAPRPIRGSGRHHRCHHSTRSGYRSG